MNQYPDLLSFSLKPDLSSQAIAATLDRLLVPGDIMDNRLRRYSAALKELHRRYCSTCPAPAWSPGLVITPEIRRQAEIYLPLAGILPAYRYLLRSACRHEPFLQAVSVFTALSWYDALAGIYPLPVCADPAELLCRAAGDAVFREKLVAAALVPARYGNGFGRYRGQLDFLAGWLRQSGKGAGIRVLDAACGSGEQCYELAELLLAMGMPCSLVIGTTVEVLELAAAAHGWFPHAPGRAALFRSRAAPVIAGGGDRMIRFQQEDIGAAGQVGSSFDIVICNGLLGGPLLHERDRLTAVVGNLVARTKKGGLLLAADRFHDGWRRAVPRDQIVALLADAGLAPVACADGLAAVRL
jgi:SAM-dependent methyltransferase